MSNFISEKIIDEVIDSFDDREYYDTCIIDFNQNQPALFAYLLSEENELLETDEKDYLAFLTVVIWESFRKKNELEYSIQPDEVNKLEDSNLRILEKAGNIPFREKLTPFFKKFEQEDLLAFIEDSIVDDDDNPITKDTRELVFLSLKTILDSLIFACSQSE